MKILAIVCISISAAGFIYMITILVMKEHCRRAEMKRANAARNEAILKATGYWED